MSSLCERHFSILLILHYKQLKVLMTSKLCITNFQWKPGGAQNPHSNAVIGTEVIFWRTENGKNDTDRSNVMIENANKHIISMQVRTFKLGMRLLSRQCNFWNEWDYCWLKERRMKLLTSSAICNTPLWFCINKKSTRISYVPKSCTI